VVKSSSDGREMTEIGYLKLLIGLRIKELMIMIANNLD
jgi:hypothetical protein